MYYNFDKNRKIISERKNTMKITNELRNYVHGKVDAIVPRPISEDEANKVKEALENLQDDYTAFIEARTKEFIEEAYKFEIFKNCVIKPSHYARRFVLSTDCSDNPVIKEFEDALKERCEFCSKAEQKIIALLSVQKEVTELDAFIASVISTIR